MSKETETYNFEANCKKCGKPFVQPVDNTAILDLCNCKFNDESSSNPSAMMGWICPNCGAGMSPYTSRCGCRDYVTWGGSPFTTNEASGIESSNLD